MKIIAKQKLQSTEPNSNCKEITNQFESAAELNENETLVVNKREYRIIASSYIDSICNIEIEPLLNFRSNNALEYYIDEVKRDGWKCDDL